MGQPIHDSSLCDRAKRCINNKLDCSSSQQDRKSVHLSNENQGPPVDGSTRPTVPRQYGLDEASPNLSPSGGEFPVPAAPDQDVASPTASEQAIPNSRQADADKALVNEFATVLAIASQIPVHQAAAVHGPVRFTVNQSMAPSMRHFLQMLTVFEVGSEFLMRWPLSDYADISINEISFTLDNQPIVSHESSAIFTTSAAADQALINRAIIELATVSRLTDTTHQTAGFLVRLYCGLFQAGGIQRDLVRRWIQSGVARLPANIDISGLPVALVENPGGTQIFTQSLAAIRAVNALERGFRFRIQQQRQSMSLSQQEQPNDSSLRYSREGPGAVEGVSDENQDSDAAVLFPGDPYLRGFTREEIYAQLSTNRYSRFSGSRRGMDGASSGEERRMEMMIRGRRNAIQMGSGALSPRSNATVTYAGPPDVDGS